MAPKRKRKYQRSKREEEEDQGYEEPAAAAIPAPAPAKPSLMAALFGQRPPPPPPPPPPPAPKVQPKPAAAAAGAGSGARATTRKAAAPALPKIKEEPVEPLELDWEDDDAPAAAAAASTTTADASGVTLPSYITSLTRANAAKAAGGYMRRAITSCDGRLPDSAVSGVRRIEAALLENQVLERMMRANTFVRSSEKLSDDPFVKLIQAMGQQRMTMPRDIEEQELYNSFLKTGTLNPASVRKIVTTYGASHERALLIDSGQGRSRTVPNKMVNRPPCMRGAKCVGQTDGIPGFFERPPRTDHERRMGKGMTLMMWMTPLELQQLETTNMQPTAAGPRWCLLCIRSEGTKMFDRYRAPAKPKAGDGDIKATATTEFTLPPLCIVQHHGNEIEPNPDGYFRTACVEPGTDEYNGVVKPMVVYNIKHYEAKWNDQYGVRVIDQERITYRPVRDGDSWERAVNAATSSSLSKTTLDLPTATLAIAAHSARASNFHG